MIFILFYQNIERILINIKMEYEYSYFDLDNYQSDNYFYDNNKVDINYYSFDGIFEEAYKLQLMSFIEYIKKNKRYYNIIMTEDNYNWYITQKYHDNEFILPKKGKFDLYFETNKKTYEDFIVNSLKIFINIPGFKLITI